MDWKMIGFVLKTAAGIGLLFWVALFVVKVPVFVLLVVFGGGGALAIAADAQLRRKIKERVKKV